MTEIWKDIAGFEGLYQVSNLGRVKSLRNAEKNKRGRPCKNGDILTAAPGSNGFVHVILTVDGKKHSKDVHRLVGSAFIPNPNNYRFLNHLDGDERNNRVDNLEWSLKMNSTNWQLKCVEQLDMDGNLLCEFRSVRSASRATGLSRSYIYKACSEFGEYGGYRWRYKKSIIGGSSMDQELKNALDRIKGLEAVNELQAWAIRYSEALIENQNLLISKQEMLIGKLRDLCGIKPRA